MSVVLITTSVDAEELSVVVLLSTFSCNFATTNRTSESSLFTYVIALCKRSIFRFWAPQQSSNTQPVCSMISSSFIENFIVKTSTVTVNTVVRNVTLSRIIIDSIVTNRTDVVTVVGAVVSLVGADTDWRRCSTCSCRFLGSCFCCIRFGRR